MNAGSYWLINYTEYVIKLSTKILTDCDQVLTNDKDHDKAINNNIPTP